MLLWESCVTERRVIVVTYERITVVVPKEADAATRKSMRKAGWKNTGWKCGKESVEISAARVLSEKTVAPASAPAEGE